MSDDFGDGGRDAYLPSSRKTFGEGKYSKFQRQGNYRYQRDTKFVPDETSKIIGDKISGFSGKSAWGSRDLPDPVLSF